MKVIVIYARPSSGVSFVENKNMVFYANDSKIAFTTNEDTYKSYISFALMKINYFSEKYKSVFLWSFNQPGTTAKSFGYQNKESFYLFSLFFFLVRKLRQHACFDGINKYFIL